MRIYLSLTAMAVLSAVVAAPIAAVQASEPSRLAAFSARQALCDKVSVALADGRVTRVERYNILTDAKEVLTPSEYETFKQAFQRVAPPQPTSVAKRSPKPKASPVLVQRAVDLDPLPPIPAPEAAPETEAPSVESTTSAIEETVPVARRVVPTVVSR